MIYHGDYVLSMKSQQQLMSLLLPEFNSSVGLKVKILKDTDFPGGFHFLRRKEFIRDTFFKKIVDDPTNDIGFPWIFHMHWTHSIEEKMDFMKQMGMWYVRNECINDTDQVLQNDDINKCCSRMPLISCKYINLPSVEECKNSKTMITRKGSGGKFWK